MSITYCIIDLGYGA